jgi:hypothetical protein
LRATPASGYNLDAWIVNGERKTPGNLLDVIVRSDLVIEPQFVLKTLVPLKGDANGDGVVNSADIALTVDYIAGRTSTGFIFGLADMDDDGFIQVNDVVGIVSLIHRSGAGSGQLLETASFTSENRLISVYSDTSIGGFDLSINNGSEPNVQILPSLSAFEKVFYTKGGGLHVMAYSPLGQGLNKQEKIELMTLLTGELTGDIVVCDTLGQLITASVITGIASHPVVKVIGIIPNPVKNEAFVRYNVSDKLDWIILRIFDNTGRLVDLIENLPVSPGEQAVPWNRKKLPNGIYHYLLDGYRGKNRIVHESGTFIIE